MYHIHNCGLSFSLLFFLGGTSLKGLTLLLFILFYFVVQALEFLPFKGKVNLKKPEHIFWILEDYGMDPNNVPEEPFDLYFGRWVREYACFSSCKLLDVCLYMYLRPDSAF